MDMDNLPFSSKLSHSLDKSIEDTQLVPHDDISVHFSLIPRQQLSDNSLF